MPKVYKIVLVDDHQVVLDGLALIINGHPEYEIAGHFTDARFAISFMKNNHVDIVFMDINMPAMNGIEATKTIREYSKDIKIIGLSMVDETAIVRQLKECGGNGFLLKNSGKDEILKAIRMTLVNGYYYDTSLMEKLISEPRQGTSIPKLSRREKEILALIIEEFTTKEIAKKLFISFGTVETHRRNMINKLGVRNTAGLVRIAIEKKLLD